MKQPSPLFADCIRDHFHLKQRHVLTQLRAWEELEQRFEASKTGSSATGSSHGLVAEGGIRSSVKIVAGFCNQIRQHIEEGWLEKDSKIVDGTGR